MVIVKGLFTEGWCGWVQAADVSGLVNEHGLLLVSVASSAIVDFCGDGELLRAESTLTW